MKVRNTLTVALLSMSLGLVSVGSSAVQAAHWHQGAPKFLRGTWRTGYIGNKYTDISVNQYSKHKKLVMDGSGMGANSRLHYKYLGKHHYQLKSFGGAKLQYFIYVRGHHLKIKGNSHVFYKVSNHLLVTE
jgi:hypothetical protein